MNSSDEPIRTAALVSIAESLNRVADSLERIDDRAGERFEAGR